ncbi:MAG: 5'-methylthioadenosine/S-adenosylhomocysteine nucleosidase [Spirochaetia bacterium]|nr:5'-methylthioadenosine/S-adenosylhomocysteine nucleosidase [Spirochaetia bacterium]
MRLILAAMEQELQVLLDRLEQVTELSQWPFPVCRGLLCGDQEVVAAVIGSGKMHAALHAARLLEHLHCDDVIMIGIAAGVDPQFHTGDLVRVSECIQYDLDLQRFGYVRGSINGSLASVITSEHPGSDSMDLPQVTAGTADRFLTAEYLKANPWLTDELGIQIADMESYAVLAAAYESHIPALVYRVIADTVSGERPKRFSSFLRTASTKLCDAVLNTPVLHISQ